MWRRDLRAGRRRARHRVDAVVRQRERTEQPAPYRALVIGTASRSRGPPRSGRRNAVMRREAAQSHRSQQLPRTAYPPPRAHGARPGDRCRGRSRRSGSVAGSRSDATAVLIRFPSGPSIDVVEVATFLEPERLGEGSGDRELPRANSRRPREGRAARVPTRPCCVRGEVPQRVDLHRLADSWGDDPIAELRVHPGELHARLAGVQQPVRGIDVNRVTRATLVPGDDIGQTGYRSRSRARSALDSR